MNLSARWTAVGVPAALVCASSAVRAQDRAMLDLAAEVGGAELRRVHPAPPDGSESLIGGALDARLYSRSGHGGMLRVGRAGEIKLFFGGRTRQVQYVDAAYGYRAAPRRTGFHIVPLLVAGPTLMNANEDYEPECLIGCRAPPQDLHALDHVALGAVVGATVDLHFGAFLLGLDGCYRLAFPVEDSPVTRDTMWTFVVRIGGSIALAGW